MAHGLKPVTPAAASNPGILAGAGAMSPFRLVVVLALAGLAVPALGADAPAPPSRSAEQDLVPFQAVQVGGRAEVVLEQGKVEHLRVERLPDDARVHAKVTNGTLRIDVEDRRPWWVALTGSRTPARVIVTFHELRGLSLTGGVDVEAGSWRADEVRVSASGGTRLRVGALQVRMLRVDGSGALRAELAGTATAQRVSISGAAEYDASRLASETASVEVSGAAKVRLDVSRTLDAEVSGAAAIEYLGDPQVHSRVSGVGRISRATRP
jgi:hypothetical protein